MNSAESQTPNPTAKSRDDFTAQTKELLARRVGHRCSNPGCRQPTAGPQEDPQKAINIGVAAHISAAASGGPRYDLQLVPEERSAASNGIWLCQTCAKLVDNDEIRYSKELLFNWKSEAERKAALALETRKFSDSSTDAAFSKLERLMPELFAEMRKDLEGHPLCREFIVISRQVTFCYPSDRVILTYFTDDHSELMGKIRILQNHGLVHDIRHNDVPRYAISEQLAEYLE
jgi:hypothetical protein